MDFAWSNGIIVSVKICTYWYTVLIKLTKIVINLPYHEVNIANHTHVQSQMYNILYSMMVC